MLAVCNYEPRRENVLLRRQQAFQLALATPRPRHLNVSVGGTMNRRVLFGPFQMAYLSGYSEAADIVGTHVKMSKANFRDVIFETLLGDKNELPKSRLLRDRFVANLRPEWAQSFLLVNSVFNPLITSHSRDRKIQGEIESLQAFLTELICAIHRGQPMALVRGLPDIKSLNGKIPVQLDMALSNLFSTFEIVTPNVVALRRTVGVRDVAAFQQILSSRLFDEYKMSHHGLSDQRITSQLSIERIEKATDKLCRNAERLTKPRGIRAFLLPLVSKGISAVFGSLPAAVADQCRIVIEPLIDPKRRIVGYQLSSIASETMASYVRLGVAKHTVQQPTRPRDG